MYQEILLLIDGNSLVYRAFHAIPSLSTTTGLPTNAVYGFTGMLLQLLKKEQPNRVAVAFDIGKKTFRHNEYHQYKAHRPPTPDDLQTQFPLVKDMVRAMGIMTLELENYEADDLLGTLSALAEQIGLRTLIITGDRDLLQLVSPTTTVMLTKKGISEIDTYDEKKILTRYGVAPCQLIDLKGMTGDPSDNIPGIKGIGEKTAIKLLKEYGSLENILANTHNLTGRTKKLFEESGQTAELSKQLATICRTVPLKIDLDQCSWAGPDYNVFLDLLKKLEFKTLIKSIYFEPKEKSNIKQKMVSDFPQRNTADYQIDYKTLDDQDIILEFWQNIRQNGSVSLALDGNLQAGITTAGFSLGNKAYILHVTGPELNRSSALDLLGTVCADKGIKKYYHHGKQLVKLLHFHGYQLNNFAFDTMLAAYLLNPAASNRNLEDIALEHLNILLSPGTGTEFLAIQADCIMSLTDVLAEKLKHHEMEHLYYEIELPLVKVLASMELLGVAVDKSMLQEMSVSLGKQITNLVEEIYQLADHEFNINSSKQLGKILFDELKLPVIKKTKTGYSTDAGVLGELAGSHEIVEKVLYYRQLTKLKSTYTDGLTALINPATERLHTSFHQAVTVTGRLSSSEPNLQNIPIRLEQGRSIRKVFIPSNKGNILLAADYSQIELRILAHICEDPVLIDAFKNGEDIHTRTAAEIFGMPLKEVTTEARRRAKAINFGIVYGLSDFGLARDIKVSRYEAKQYIENYFARYAGVKKYMESIITEARTNGYVTTLLNRRRYLPDLHSPNRTIRNACERTAINTPVQGSAADIIKLAMVNIHHAMVSQGFKAMMLLQVHDELIFDTPIEEEERLKQLVKNKMENIIALKVPLDVVISTGANWYDAK